LAFSSTTPRHVRDEINDIKRIRRFRGDALYKSMIDTDIDIDKTI